MNDETLVWIKAKMSGGSSGNCVEVAVTPDGNRAIRDSKNPDGGMLCISREAFGEFLKDCASSLDAVRTYRIRPDSPLIGANPR